MSDRKATPFPILLNNDVCSLIQAADNVYQIRYRGARIRNVSARSKTSEPRCPVTGGARSRC